MSNCLPCKGKKQYNIDSPKIENKTVFSLNDNDKTIASGT